MTTVRPWNFPIYINGRRVRPAFGESFFVVYVETTAETFAGPVVHRSHEHFTTREEADRYAARFHQS